MRFPSASMTTRSEGRSRDLSKPPPGVIRRRSLLGTRRLMCPPSPYRPSECSARPHKARRSRASLSSDVTSHSLDQPRMQPCPSCLYPCSAEEVAYVPTEAAVSLPRAFHRHKSASDRRHGEGGRL